jgi:RNA polymerase sigma factor (sigma-70 family)
VDDFELLERWRAGDHVAGRDLFARHLRDIHRFFRNKVGAEADDLVQATFLACVTARDRFRGLSTFRTYLFAIARHELYGFLRRLPGGDDVDFELTSIEEIATSPGSRLDRARRADGLRVALAHLPVEQQLLLELHYWHELDAAGLAEVFEATPGAIRVRLVRARRALRDQLERLGPGATAGMEVE